VTGGALDSALTRPHIARRSTVRIIIAVLVLAAVGVFYASFRRQRNREYNCYASCWEWRLARV